MEKNKSVSLSEIVQHLSQNRTYLMGVAMLMVILFHCGIPPFKYFGYWGVDVFLFLSGFGIYYALKKNESLIRFYYKRFLRILPPALICGVAFHCLGCDHGYRELSLFGLNLWYIRSILLFYLISPFLYICILRWGIKAVPLIFCVAEILSYYSPYIFSSDNAFGVTMVWSLPRLPIYVIGMALPFWAARQDISIHKSRLLIAALMGIIILFTLLLYQKNCHLNKTYFLFMPSPLLVPAILFAGIVTDFLRKRAFLSVSLFFNFLGVFSLEIYLIHEALLKYAPGLKEYVWKGSVAKLICILFSFGLAFLLHMLCNIIRVNIMNYRAGLKK